MPTDQYAKKNGGQKICYRVYGKGLPIVLVPGLGLQLVYWPPQLIKTLNEAGFQVIAPDNRDAGLSFHCNDLKPPSPTDILFRRKRPEMYSLDDMAEDTTFLLDHLDIQSAHLLGISMGGMISQNIAASHPDRVKSLTSVFSSTGNPRLGQPHISAAAKIFSKRPTNKEGFISHMMDVYEIIGKPNTDEDRDFLISYFDEAYDRHPNSSSGTARQLAAIIQSGDRSSVVKNIKVPTLVLHGTTDNMVHPNGGRATAKLIPGAIFQQIDAMQHHISGSLVKTLSTVLLPFLQVH